MLRTIQTLLVPSKGRVTPIWDKTIYDINNRTTIYKRRFDQTEVIFTHGVNLLRYLALNVDLDYLITQTNDFDLYTYNILPMLDSVRKNFDPIYTGREEKNLFVQRLKNDVPEFILNVQCSNPMMTMPFGKSWEAWQHIHPIRIVYHDADELVSNLVPFYINFKGEPPTRIVISIDIAQFFMKLVKYAQFVKATEHKEINVNDFIQHHIVAQWYQDLIQIWCLNLIEHVIMAEDEIELKLVETTLVDPAIVDAALNNGINTINQEVQRVKQLSITIEEFLSTKWLNGRSYYDVMTMHLSALGLPDQRQYIYLRFLADAPIVRTVLRLANFRSNIGIVPQLRIMLLRKLELYDRSKIESNIHTVKLQALVRTELQEMLSLVTR